MSLRRGKESRPVCFVGLIFLGGRVNLLSTECTILVRQLFFLQVLYSNHPINAWEQVRTASFEAHGGFGARLAEAALPLGWS